MNRRMLLRAVTLLSFAAVPVATLAEDLFSVGAAKVDVTPPHPVVLAGYGGRQGEHTAVDTPLWARALVIGDDRPVAIVTLDNCGVPAAVRQRVVERLNVHGITSDRLVISCTHTHNAPSLEGYASILWAGRLDEEQQKHVSQYTAFVIQKMADAVVAALKEREPMTLAWGRGRLTFGGNRRVLNNGQWAGFGFQRNGPVDHSLPLLVARDSQNKVRAVWANYACHCTTAGSANRINGDWAGFAGAALDREFPESVGLVSIGCGADVGPQPSGSLDLARQHGESLATEAARVISSGLTALTQPPVATSSQIQLPIDAPQSREFWDEQLRRGGFHNQLAQLMISRLQGSGEIAKQVNYPLTVWKFGDQLLMVFMAGEVCVDYSVLLNAKLDWRRLWLTAWSNDMPGYIPSRRVLEEGGYEAEFSQVYYAQPGRYLPEIQDVVVAGVDALAGPTFRAAADQKHPDFDRLPSGEELLWKNLANRVATLPSTQRKTVSRFRSLAANAANGCAQFRDDDSAASDWFNFCGDTVSRRFIRQESEGTEIRWTAESPKGRSSGLYVFSGGIGWQSQPAKGFELQVNDTTNIQFDITQKPTSWTDVNKTTELIFVPTWTSDEDASGFFLLRVPGWPAEKPLQLSVRSRGSGSQRWFAIDREQDFPDRLQKLLQALDSPSARD